MALTELKGRPLGTQKVIIERGPVPNLEVVLSDVDPSLDPLSLWRFFVSPDPDLTLDGVSMAPRDWLVAGADPARVRALLRDL